MDQQHLDRLKKIIAVYLPEDVDQGAITLTSDLTSELNINSSHLVDIILDVEDAFDITLENDDMDNMKTVEDALRIIKKKRAESTE
ncbi:acyl carrier protein [Robertkochia aurantiaca]|uniref:acyl carrier protein n=1 Tax=Robertkochia aurantiaca TaxID=2873700 RepID=UPI001CCAAC56|nr:phosphopantetheine-binding protein [Robertkochia sp. 3YJGBD-33]